MTLDRDPSRRPPLPLRDRMEAEFNARVIVYDDNGTERPGGKCRCCDSGPDPYPNWRFEPLYIYKAGLCDMDGVYYGMLCETCLEDIRAENERRPHTERDETARQITELMDGDLDGAQTMMDDFE